MAQHTSRLRCTAMLGAALLLGTPAVAHAGPNGTTTQRGVLQRVVADPIGGGPAQHRTTVVTASGATIDVPESLAGRIRSGSAVELRQDPSGRVTGLAGDASAAADESQGGMHHLVLVPVYWKAGDTAASLPSNAEFTGLAGEIDKFYDGSTNGAVRFTLDRITKPQKVPVTGCDPGALETAAREIAGDTVHDRFHHIAVYFPEGDCDWAGLGYLGASQYGDSFSWINGYTMPIVLAHELGHNLGLSHSDAYHCWSDTARTTPVPLSDSCEVEAYGDPWDVMGRFSTGQMIAANLDILGVLGDGGTLPVRDGEEVVLAPLSGGTGLRQVTFTRGTRTYYLEYRDLGGLDAPLVGLQSGLAVRFTDTALDSYRGDHQLISFHPADDVPVLRSGESWSDPAGSFSVKVGTATGAGLPITVSLDGSGGDGDGAPVGSPAPTASLRSGGTVSAGAVPVKVSWGLTDADGIARQRFAREVPADTAIRWRTLGPAVREATSTTKPGTPARWQLDVEDTAGNAGTVVGDWTSTTLSNRGSRYTGTWRTSRRSGLLDGSEQTTSARNAAVSYTFEGHSVGLIGTRSAQSGAFDIYVDGRKVGTCDTYSATTRSRSLYYVVNFAEAGTHTVKVVNRATSGHPRLNLDAFAVLS
jgi:hypothetical protein